jgi:hypothetical protein
MMPRMKSAFDVSRTRHPNNGSPLSWLGELVWSGLLSTNLLSALYVYRRERQFQKAS